MSGERTTANRAKAEYEQTEIAFATVRQVMVDTLLSSNTVEHEMREKLYLGVQVLDAVRASLMQAISTAEIEQYADEIRESGIVT